MNELKINPQFRDLIPPLADHELAGLEEDISKLSGHTIMLVQFSSNEETRTFIDCETPSDAMETFCRIYENFLLNKKGLLPNADAEMDGDEEA